MRTSKIKATRLMVLLALLCSLLAGSLNLPGSAADAAAKNAAAKKAAVSSTAMTIPVGKLDSKVFWNSSSWEISNGQKLTVKNPLKKAAYQFTSSSSAVVKIGKTGGYLTGVKAGSATITCTQTYNGKKTTVGKCKVTVKNAGLTVSDYENEFPVGNGKFDLADYYSSEDPMFNITYRNSKATYDVTSNSDDFTVKVIKYDASKVKEVSSSKEYQEVLKSFIGDRYFYGYEFTAKKAGTYTVTVKETYNKKTKTIGSFKIDVKDTSISEAKKELLLGNNLDVLSLISYQKANTDYYVEIKDFDEAKPENNVLRLSKNEMGTYLYANKTGTAEVIVKEGSETGTVIGTVTIVVTESPCESITLDSEEYTTYVGDESFSLSYSLEPWETTDKVTIESDKPAVLKVEYNEKEETWVYTPLKAGEVNITIKCGKQSAVAKVVVEKE
jgi:hypothetical protein